MTKIGTRSLRNKRNLMNYDFIIVILCFKLAGYKIYVIQK